MLVQDVRRGKTSENSIREVRNASSAPFIVGIGGTPREGSSTELALRYCFHEIERMGGQTKIFGGVHLSKLPHFAPGVDNIGPECRDLIEAVRMADGVVIATPSYHGTVSGVVKNALDSLELLSRDERPYFHNRPVGCIVTVGGWQGAGTALMSLRSIIHALRGWPTPMGAALKVTKDTFDNFGNCRNEEDAGQLSVVAQQVMDMAQAGTRAAVDSRMVAPN